jgi:hypothetical protein
MKAELIEKQSSRPRAAPTPADNRLGRARGEVETPFGAPASETFRPEIELLLQCAKSRMGMQNSHRGFGG